MPGRLSGLGISHLNFSPRAAICSALARSCLGDCSSLFLTQLPSWGHGGRAAGSCPEQGLEQALREGLCLPRIWGWGWAPAGRDILVSSGMFPVETRFLKQFVLVLDVWTCLLPIVLCMILCMWGQPHGVLAEKRVGLSFCSFYWKFCPKTCCSPSLL